MTCGFSYSLEDRLDEVCAEGLRKCNECIVHWHSASSLYIYTHATGQLMSENKLITDCILDRVLRFTTCMAELLILQRKHLAYRSSEGCPAQGITSATRTMILSFAMSLQFQQSIISND